ncbi:E3 ubiquitin protein ligase DRIP2 [Apostasia shenzhenica]|uniref:E3 ubiquitin protein ligase DRIP2 n=1 Tax=Apostasia shenzhenica TaxID=1088818 RepID=A0A2I0AXJ3_9ASPA|nr:E3 ubiquitin protein ligase DRIP2 [Apostasia shenzhenica]
MAPASKLQLYRHCNSYGGCFADSRFVSHHQKSTLIPPLMADEPPSSSKEGGRREQEREAQEKEEEEEEPAGQGWLQLGIGGTAPVFSPELRLFPERPPHFPSAPATASAAPPGAPGDFRVVIPPPRRPTGIWISLRASENQVKEPFLPQLPKSYLRIKEGRMTIRLLMRYLVNKLGLQDESEVEIICRGQQLHPFSTLQDARDHLWGTSDAPAPAPGSPTADHVMTLYYRRRA